MLPVSLALCDGFAAKKFVSTAATSLIALPEFPKFEERSTKKDFDLLHRLESIYEQTVKAGFSFNPDEFGGHSLRTSQTRSANKILMFPVGLMAKIKPTEEHQFDDLSTIDPTKLCKYPRLLAGSIRFVNSSCDPNCKYEFTSMNGHPCVRLKTLRRIEAGEEITVYYGKTFFRSLECRCSCDVHLHEQQISAGRSQPELASEGSGYGKITRRHITLSDYMSNTGEETAKSYKRKRTVLMGNSFSGATDDLRVSLTDTSSDFSSLEETQHEEPLHKVRPVGSSTPIHGNEDHYDSIPVVNVELESSTSSDSERSLQPMDQPMNARAEIGLKNLKSCLTAIGSKHRASDALMNDVLKVFRLTCPNMGLPGIKTFKNERNLIFILITHFLNFTLY